MRVSHSLRGQLLTWLLVPLTLLLIINIGISYLNAKATAGLVQDATLVASARSIAERTSVNDGLIETLIPPSAIERFSTSAPDRVVYSVLGPSGELLAGYPDVQAPDHLPQNLQPYWYNSQFRGLPIRAVALEQPLTGAPKRYATVIVGQTLRSYGKMINQLWRQTIWQESLMVLVAGALALIGLKRGIEPMMRLRNSIRDKDPRSLNRFDPDVIQSELRPLVLALNRAIDRIEDQIKQRRQFIADAAHQLRTPLALLRTQAAVGQKSIWLEEKDEAFAAVAMTAADMSRLTNQLLMFARAEAEEPASNGRSVDMAEIVRAVLATEADRALTDTKDLSLEAEGDPLLVQGNPTLLMEAITNLIDNALHYTPPKGSIKVALAKDQDWVRLSISDTGPGIPISERERVFTRFYRIAGANTEGSGLGLAIVQMIVKAHGGTIELKDPAQGPGLVVDISLPAVQGEL